MRVAYDDGEFPEEVLTAVVPLMRECQRWAPRWMRLLEVRYNADPNEVATVAWHPEYFRAVLWIGSQFIERPDHLRRDCIAHELAHLHVAHLADVALAFRDALLAGMDGPAAQLVREQWRYAMEASTSCVQELVESLRDLKGADDDGHIVHGLVAAYQGEVEPRPVRRPARPAAAADVVGVGSADGNGARVPRDAGGRTGRSRRS